MELYKMKKLKVLDLFSGLGGFSLGLERTGHFKTVAFCDNNKYSKLILDKHWKGIKIYDDVREITKENFETDGIETPDIITGGFPCQPFSVAGKQKGTGDDRHLWPEMFRIIKVFQPKFVIGENVPGIVNIQDGVVFETVCTNLEDEGYEVQPFNIPAAAVGAPHQRKRIWFIAVRSDVANTVSNDERREISRSYEEERRIQEEHRQNNSTTGKSSRTSEIRNGDNGYENVANTKNGRGQPSQSERWEGIERGSINSRGIEGERKNFSGTEDVADTNSGLRRGGRTVGQSREDEDRFLHSKEEEQAREHLRSETVGRSSIRGETDVADTDTRLSNGENKEIQSRGQTSISSSEGTNKKLADTNGEGLEGFGQSSRQLSKTFFATDSSEERQRTMDQGWWSVEPNVGRVAHGVSGRVHRLKGLGNSIVPQIVEEIGYAIVKAMK
jgi:DNA (cytosine-5)-methyltransferase 1